MHLDCPLRSHGEVNGLGLDGRSIDKAALSDALDIPSVCQSHRVLATVSQRVDG